MRRMRKATSSDVWASRFMSAAIVQGAIMVGLTAFLVLGQAFAKLEVARVIAGGSAGTWFTFGYMIYIIVAVLGVAVSSLFYHYLDVNMGSAAKALAWAHLVLMNVGASAAAGMMMYGWRLSGRSCNASTGCRRKRA
jgi:hypothetical protein